MLSSNSAHSGIHIGDLREHSDVQLLTSQYNNTNDNNSHRHSSAIKKKHTSSMTSKSSATHANSLAAKHIIGILDTVSMLMSRQIRGTVERSLRYVIYVIALHSYIQATVLSLR
jgi:hypothetical protein